MEVFGDFLVGLVNTNIPPGSHYTDNNFTLTNVLPHIYFSLSFCA